MSDSDGMEVDDLIEAARSYGAGDPDEEISALQDLLRAAWGLMTERQQTDFVQTDEVQSLLQADDEEGDEE